MSNSLHSPATATHRALAGALRSALRGEVIDRDHPDYDRARRVWNGLIDRLAEVRRAYDPTGLFEAAARRP
jgi:hypothetical protein